MNKLYCHPENVETLKRELRGTFEPRGDRGLSILSGLPVVASSLMPKRIIDKVWSPPTSGRFTEYESEDEYWMRPLGIGTVEEIDRGPAFFLMNVPDVFDLSNPEAIVPIEPLCFP